MAHVLVVDDDDLVVELLKRILQRDGYRVSAAANGTGMREALAVGDVDLVLLDIRLGTEHGFALAPEIRDQYQVPVIFVSGDGEVADKVAGLEIGADDYITKPFDARELLARTKVVLRRHQNREQRPTRTLRFRGFTLDLDAHELHAPDGAMVELTGLELQVLACLAERPRQAMSRDDISRIVSGRVRDRQDRTLDVVVSKVRKKLGDAGGPDASSLISTVRGVGYKFTGQIETA